MKGARTLLIVRRGPAKLKDIKNALFHRFDKTVNDLYGDHFPKGLDGRPELFTAVKLPILLVDLSVHPTPFVFYRVEFR